MARKKNTPVTNNTAKKSTTPRGPRPNHEVGLQSGRSRDSREMFKKRAARLEAQVHAELIHYKGPTGLGRGKGGLKRSRPRREAQTGLPSMRDIELWAGDNQCAIALAPFARLVKQLVSSNGLAQTKRFQRAAIEAMRRGAESYLVTMFETSNLFVAHARRVTVMCKDLVLFKRVLPMEPAYIDQNPLIRQNLHN